MIPYAEFQNVGEDALKNLIESPTFAMSLGGKELFHTNFLAFLLESEHSSINKVTNTLKQRLFGSDFKGAVWAFRERKNMDLIIVPKDPYSQSEYSAVIIEAKMKSVPSLDQLDSYNEKLFGGSGKKYFDIGEVDFDDYDRLRLSDEKSIEFRTHGHTENSYKWVNGASRKIRCILLAPSNPYSKKLVSEKHKQWEYWSWLEIQSLLVSALELYPTKDNALLSLVECYSKDLKNIIVLLEITKKYVDSFFCVNGSKLTFDSFDRTIIEPFKKARIHDLISKYAYWCLSQKIQDQFHHVSPNLNFDVNYSKGSPIFEITRPLEQSEVKREIGVQIQSGQYRHFILSRKPDKFLREFASKHIDWFKNIDRNVDVMGLNKFDDERFLYSKKDIKKYTFDCLCNELRISFKKCPN